MTPDQRLRDMVTDNPRFLHPMITDDVRLLLAQRDRYEKALREIANSSCTCSSRGCCDPCLAQEALRCE